jgi:hypothetical protein
VACRRCAAAEPAGDLPKPFLDMGGAAKCLPWSIVTQTFFGRPSHRLVSYAFTLKAHGTLSVLDMCKSAPVSDCRRGLAARRTKLPPLRKCMTEKSIEAQ